MEYDQSLSVSVYQMPFSNICKTCVMILWTSHKTQYHCFCIGNKMFVFQMLDFLNKLLCKLKTASCLSYMNTVLLQPHDSYFYNCQFETKYTRFEK